jgi:hypothetical protein
MTIVAQRVIISFAAYKPEKSFAKSWYVLSWYADADANANFSRNHTSYGIALHSSDIERLSLVRTYCQIKTCVRHPEDSPRSADAIIIEFREPYNIEPEFPQRGTNMYGSSSDPIGFA